jgi:hypothetical protein
MHSLTEDDPDTAFRTSNDTNLSIWPLHSFSAFHRECRNMLVTLAQLVGVLLWERTLPLCRALVTAPHQTDDD